MLSRLTTLYHILACILQYCSEEFLKTRLDDLERVDDGIEWSPELVTRTCKHDLLHLDSVLGFIEIDDVSSVNEDMHYRGNTLPLDIQRLDIEIPADFSVRFVLTIGNIFVLWSISIESDDFVLFIAIIAKQSSNSYSDPILTDIKMVCTGCLHSSCVLQNVPSSGQALPNIQEVFLFLGSCSECHHSFSQQLESDPVCESFDQELGFCFQTGH
ncbi:unnamed protein product [Moneuplotes crassus]|uniref:Uncharacterized protein n=1 Tax=Euplotes crassus TaxID=5936 RepID=A0AAD2CWW4_EUPCR|nr:unnamed protein product [Moneuplotes crassus]